MPLLPIWGCFRNNYSFTLLPSFVVMKHAILIFKTGSCGTKELADATPISSKMQYNVILCNTNLHIFFIFILKVRKCS